MYEYEISSLRVIDGDTITATVDLGFGVHKKETFRLYGINAPETRGPEKAEGIRATKALRMMATTPGTTIRTIKRVNRRGETLESQGKFGRYLAILVLCSGKSLNDWMVESGHAVRSNY